MPDEGSGLQFEQVVKPHLDAAYNLARWLVRNDHDAEDLVQESCLRAFKAISGYRGGDARAWLLAIVRNACYTWMQKRINREPDTDFDEAIHSTESTSLDAERALLAQVDRDRLAAALEALPLEYRETLVLREIEGLSYKEISDVVGVPMGTVMSRLARARTWLRRRLTERPGKEVAHDVR